MIALNVAQFLKEPPGSHRKFDFSDTPEQFGPEIALAAPIVGHAELLRTSRGILASTRYNTAIYQACGRCLNDTIVPIEGSSDDEFMPRVDVLTGLVLDEQAESEELVISENHLLDLTEVIRQDLLTRVPLQALCSADCPGLCPECGRDLREGACNCDRAGEGSSPFAGLAELLRARSAEHRSPD